MLVEINPGTWVRPELITSINARSGGPNPWKPDGEPIKPKVHIMMGSDEAAGWEFEAYDDAKAFAAKMAAAVNEAQDGE